MNIVSTPVNNIEKNWIQTLEGEWYPKSIDVEPLKFTIDENSSGYHCKKVNEDSKKLILESKENTNIVKEIKFINANEITVNIINIGSIGVSPSITFIKN